MTHFITRSKAARWDAIRGFTLIELMVAVAIVSIGLAVALPSFRGFSVRQQVVQAGNELVADLALARNEALRRGVRVELQANAGGWNTGWNVVADTNRDGQVDAADGDPLRVRTELPKGFALNAVVGPSNPTPRTRVAFATLGAAVPTTEVPAANGAAQFCLRPPGGDAAQTRVIDLGNGGVVSTFTGVPSKDVVGC